MNLLPITQRIAVLVTVFTSASITLLVQTTIDAQLSHVVEINESNTHCGNGATESLYGEECDDGLGDGYEDTDSDDDYGESTSSEAHRPNCGDGLTQGSEECDTGSIKNGLLHTQYQATSSSSSSVISTSSSSTSTQHSNDDEDNDVKEEQKKDVQEQQQQESEDRIEQREKQLEEMKRKAAEAMKNARKMREEVQQKAEAAEKNKETPTQTSDAEPESDLRCFDSDGNLTADRDKCDIEKEKLLHPDVEIPEEEAREKLRTKLLGDDIAEKRRAELLETMSNARERLMGLSETGNHTPQIDEYLSDSVAWLERGIEYFSQGPRSIQEIQSMVAPVKQLLAQTTSLLQQEKKLPNTVKVDINPIIIKTERLILKFRESIIALATAGVTSDPETIEHYSRAAEQFVAIREDCAQDELQCGRLREVLDILKLIQEPVMNDLGENPEVLQAVEAKFAE